MNMIHPNSTNNTTRYHRIQKIPKHKQTLVSTHQTYVTAVPKGIYTNTPTRLIQLLQSDTLLPKKMYPAPGNQLLVLLNMVRYHSKTNHKVYPRFRNHFQKSPQTTKRMTSYRSRWKCNTYINQGRRKKKWGTLPDIWPNWNIIMTLPGNL